MSDDEDTEPQSRVKSAVFTEDERKLILKLVNLHYDVLNNKTINCITTQQKQQAWQEIHKMYLENTTLIKQPRTLKQLRRCWENMKGKAKKGIPSSVKLIQWAEDQYNIINGETYGTEDKVNRSQNSLDAVGEASKTEPKHEFLHHKPKDKPEELQNSSKQSLDENFLKIKEALDNSECKHCACEKIEKNAKVQLMVLQKNLSEELHQLELLLVREKLKNERELHKLHVHEISLKIENERRRAEILDKELNN